MVLEAKQEVETKVDNAAAKMQTVVRTQTVQEVAEKTEVDASATETPPVGGLDPISGKEQKPV